MAYAIGVSGAFALTSAWMVLAAAIAGPVLREVHYEVAGTRSFAMVRRYGVWGALWRFRRRLLCPFTGNGHPMQTPYGRRIAAGALLLVPLVGGLGAPVPLVLGSFIPDNPATGGLRDAVVIATVVTAALGACVTSWLWLRGLSYVARPQVRRGQLPRFTPPDGLSRRGRDRVMINAYWYRRLRTADAIAFVYPMCLVIFVVSYGNPSFETGRTSPQDSPHLVLIVLLPVIAAGVSSHVVRRRVEHRLAAAQAVAEICAVLQPPKPEGHPAPPFPDIVPDPFREQRLDLTRVSTLLDDAANQFDLKQPRGFTPHPMASVLRATAVAIRDFLRSPSSVGAAVPPDLRETLRLTVLVLAEANNAGVFEQLATRTAAFDASGAPTAEQFARPPGRLEVLYARATSSVQRTAAVVGALGTLTGIAIASALAVIGRLDLASLLGHLK